MPNFKVVVLVFECRVSLLRCKNNTLNVEFEARVVLIQECSVEHIPYHHIHFDFIWLFHLFVVLLPRSEKFRIRSSVGGALNKYTTYLIVILEYLLFADFFVASNYFGFAFAIVVAFVSPLFKTLVECFFCFYLKEMVDCSPILWQLPLLVPDFFALTNKDAIAVGISLCKCMRA